MMSFSYRLGVMVACGGLLGALASGCAEVPAADGAEAGGALSEGRGDGTPAVDAAAAADVVDAVDTTEALAAPTVLASGQELPVDVAVDDASVYWGIATDFGLGPALIRSTPKAGGGPVTDVVPGTLGLGDFSLDATRVFWGEGAAEPGAGGVRSTPKGGGAVTDLLDDVRAFQIALDGSDIYVASPDAGGRLLKLPKAGGATTTLAVVGPGLDNTPSLAFGGDKLFFSQSTFDVDCDGRVSFVPKAGGAVVSIADGICGLLSIKADALSVYWAQWDEAAQVGKIVRKTAPFTVGAPTTLATLSTRPTFLALDAFDVYYVAGGPADDGSVRRVSKFGGGRRTLATGQVLPLSIALDKHFVYWTTFDGEVKRVAKLATRSWAGHTVGSYRHSAQSDRQAGGRGELPPARALRCARTSGQFATSLRSATATRPRPSASLEAGLGVVARARIPLGPRRCQPTVYEGRGARPRSSFSRC